jgi:hypothetical protein
VLQKRAPAVSGALHTAQLSPRRVPQWRQKLAPASLTVEHVGQITVCGVSDRRVRGSTQPTFAVLPTFAWRGGRAPTGSVAAMNPYT